MKGGVAVATSWDQRPNFHTKKWISEKHVNKVYFSSCCCFFVCVLVVLCGDAEVLLET